MEWYWWVMTGLIVIVGSLFGIVAWASKQMPSWLFDDKAKLPPPKSHR